MGHGALYHTYCHGDRHYFVHLFTTHRSPSYQYHHYALIEEPSQSLISRF